MDAHCTLFPPLLLSIFLKKKKNKTYRGAQKANCPAGCTIQPLWVQEGRKRTKAGDKQPRGQDLKPFSFPFWNEYAQRDGQWGKASDINPCQQGANE